MRNDESRANKKIDMHVHVGVLGDEDPAMGRLTGEYRRRIEYKVFLLFACLKEEDVSDEKLLEETIKIIDSCQLDHAVLR
jgi:hypothetical protein